MGKPANIPASVQEKTLGQGREKRRATLELKHHWKNQGEAAGNSRNGEDTGRELVGVGLLGGLGFFL